MTGVIPKFLMEKEIGKIDLPDLRIVESMHERKAVMAELADGFMALPGGFGTLEEFCEVLTWGQLGLHAKPFGLLNIRVYDHFLAFIDGAVARQFIKAKHGALILTERGAGGAFGDDAGVEAGGGAEVDYAGANLSTKTRRVTKNG